jgi:hypothetical protein
MRKVKRAARRLGRGSLIPSCDAHELDNLGYAVRPRAGIFERSCEWGTNVKVGETTGTTPTLQELGSLVTPALISLSPTLVQVTQREDPTAGSLYRVGNDSTGCSGRDLSQSNLRSSR